MDLKVKKKALKHHQTVELSNGGQRFGVRLPIFNIFIWKKKTSNHQNFLLPEISVILQEKLSIPQYIQKSPKKLTKQPET